MVDTIQPQRLCRFQILSGVVATRRMELQKWNNPNQIPGAHHPIPASCIVDRAGCRESNSRLRRTEKNVLDIPSYRTGHLVTNPEMGSGLDAWPTFALDKCAFTNLPPTSGRKWLLSFLSPADFSGASFSHPLQTGRG